MNKQSSLTFLAVAVVIALGVFYAAKNQPVETVDSITHGHGLAVDVLDSSKVYIATHHGLLLFQEGAGLSQVGNAKDDYMGFSAHPAQAHILYSSGHPSLGGNIGVQKSEDGGVTWKKISDGIGGPVDFHAMTISPADPNSLYGWYRGNLQKSTDGGISWQVVNDEIVALQLVADSKDPNTVYAAGAAGEGILVTRDGGTSWSVLSPDLASGQVAAIAVDPSDPNHILVYSESLGGLAQSADQGATWKKINEPFDGTVFFTAFSPKDPRTVYALTHVNSLYKSGDGGETWEKK